MIDLRPVSETPAMIDAEWGVLGALLARNAGYEGVAGYLEPKHFFEPEHGRLFAAIERELLAGRRADPTTLGAEFDAKFLSRLASVAISHDTRTYAEALIGLWQRRALIELTGEIDALAHTIETPIETLRESVDQRLAAIFAGSDARAMVALADTVKPTLAAIAAAARGERRTLGIPTGLRALDDALGGLMPGELIVLAGRPGMGKSCAAKTMALAAARAGHAVGYFSLEMSAEQLTQWCLADLTGIAADRQRCGAVDAAELERLTAAGAELATLPLVFDDRGGLGMTEIRGRARVLQRRKGPGGAALGLVVIDHLGLIRASREAHRHSMVAAVSEVTAELKRLAKDLGVPVLALAQLNRGVESREDKRPLLSDLRDSGSIEQDADVVIMAYREAYYLRAPATRHGEAPQRAARQRALWAARCEAAAGAAELILMKHRNGPLATIHVRFEPERQRLTDASPT